MERTDEQRRAELERVATTHPDEQVRAQAAQYLDALPKQDISEFARPGLAGRIAGAAQGINRLPDRVPALGTALGAIERFGSGLTMRATDALGDISGTSSPEDRAKFQGEHPMLASGAEFTGMLNPRSASTQAARGLENLAMRGGETLAERSPRVMALLGRAAAAPGAGIAARAAEGGGIGATLGAVQGATQNHDSPWNMLEGAWEGAKSGGISGAVLGGASGVAAPAARAMRTPDIALLEKYGMEPTAVPGRPVGVQGESALTSIKKAVSGAPSPLGVRKASPATRQTAAIESAGPIVNDLAARERVNSGQIEGLRARNETRYNEPTTPTSGILTGLDREAGVPGTSPSVRGRIATLRGEVERASKPLSNDPSQRGAGREDTIPERHMTLAETAALKAAQLEATDPWATVEGGRASQAAPPAPGPKGLNDAAKQALDGLAARRAKLIATGQPIPQALEDNIAVIRGSVPAEAPADVPNALRPPDLQRIRNLADSMANQDKNPLTKVSDDEARMRGISARLRKRLPTEMQNQDRNFSRATGRIEESKRSLGLGSSRLRLDEPTLSIRAGNTIARAGENTKAGANAEKRLAYLRENGAPAVMASAREQAPDQIDYGTLLDKPKLQLAQEKLQLDPGSVFSGARYGHLGSHVVHGLVSRLAYPAAARAANVEIGAHPLVFDRLVSAMRRRNSDQQE